MFFADGDLVPVKPQAHRQSLPKHVVVLGFVQRDEELFDQIAADPLIREFDRFLLGFEGFDLALLLEDH